MTQFGVVLIASSAFGNTSIHCWCSLIQQIYHKRPKGANSKFHSTIWFMALRGHRIMENVTVLVPLFHPSHNHVRNRICRCCFCRNCTNSSIPRSKLALDAFVHGHVFIYWLNNCITSRIYWHLLTIGNVPIKSTAMNSPSFKGSCIQLIGSQSRCS